MLQLVLVETQMLRLVLAWHVTCCCVCFKWWIRCRHAALMPSAAQCLSVRRVTDICWKPHTNASMLEQSLLYWKQFWCSVCHSVHIVIVHAVFVITCNFSEIKQMTWFAWSNCSTTRAESCLLAAHIVNSVFSVTSVISKLCSFLYRVIPGSEQSSLILSSHFLLGLPLAWLPSQCPYRRMSSLTITKIH